MNILLIANELRYSCGVTNHLLHLTRGLAENKADRIFLITGGGNGIERFNDLNVEVIKDERFLHENRSSVNYINAINALARFIRKNKIDIVHSHSHFAANITSHANMLGKIRRIQTNHGLLKDEGKLKHFTADRYVAINEHIYRHIIDNKIAASADVVFIRCGIPVPTEPAQKNEGKINVISASRFTPEKSLDTFIKAVSKLPEEIRTKAEFFVAGEGELENELKILNERLKAGINFPGSVRNLNEWLGKAHILVFTSVSKTEGFPAVITEAGASDNLLISSEFYGVQSVVQDKVDGFLFTPGEESELASLLGYAIRNFDECKPLALHFYNKVKDLFDLEKMITKHQELYAQCVRK